MVRLIFNVVILITYLIIMFNNSSFCVLEKKCLHDLDSYMSKEYFSPYVTKESFNYLFEFSHSLFKYNNNLRYQTYIRTQYDLDDKNFLFFKNTMLKGHSHNYRFKNIFSIGFGYNIFNGPIYCSRIEFAPNLYYIYNTHKNYLTMLVSNSLTYSYQLIKDIYYSQHVTALANSNHIFINSEHALSFPIRKDTIFFKCSYNVIINENKFHKICPNINKYVFISLICSI